MAALFVVAGAYTLVMVAVQKVIVTMHEKMIATDSEPILYPESGK